MAILITDRDYEEKAKVLMDKNIDINKMEGYLVPLLDEKGLKIATAESCTGGMISQRITNISGAGQVFECGVCSYGNCIKEKVLGVKGETLSNNGAVSEETATEMCCGVKKIAQSDIGISTTGIAGPTGGTGDKPVGLVYIGVNILEKITIYRAELCHYKQHKRNEVRHMAASLALALAYEEAENFHRIENA